MSSKSVNLRCCIFQRNRNAISETFITAHGERLPGVVAVVHLADRLPAIDGVPVLSETPIHRAVRKLARTIRQEAWGVEEGYSAVLRRCEPNVVLAESGPIAVRALSACRKRGVPIVAHFHGSDASDTRCLERHRESYPLLFREAAAVIAVSTQMVERLTQLGCPPEKIFYNPYGVELAELPDAAPAETPPTFLSVGRMVPKKAPFLTLLAFAQAVEEVEARLRMIGDGDLLGPCSDLAVGLGIRDRVEFLGAQDHATVFTEMQRARGFVQHSVTAASGDSEGTPVAILEASAIGLPVVATAHAGIPDVIVDGKTGLLSEERDIPTMAENIRSLAADPALAAELGKNGAAHVRRFYSMEASIMRLARILAAGAGLRPLAEVREEIYAELPPTRLPSLSSAV